MTWRYANASVVGTSHLAGGVPCQDASLVRVLTDPLGNGILVAAVADGAGSAVHSAEGARLVVAGLLVAIGRYLESGRSLADVSRIEVDGWLETVRAVIAAKAAPLGAALGDFAATALACAIGHGVTVWVQLGDGAIILGNGRGGFRVACWPQQGEYANETNFVTGANALMDTEFGLEHQEAPQIALFTDGLQRLLLNYADQAAHAPWFATQFAVLAEQAPGTHPGLCQAISDLISTRRFTDETDDDRTLILACRPPVRP